MRSQWATYSLGELTSERPIAYGVLKPGPRQKGGVPLIRITDIKNNYLDESDLYLITQELSQEFKRSVLQGGEVLISIQGTIGRVAIVPQHLNGANISRTIALIAPDERVLREFLRYWLLSMQDQFPVGGATRDSLNIGDIRKLRCPLPSLNEQQRIVRLLDEAFQGIAIANANAEKNLQNSRALFKSQLQTKFAQDGEGWVNRPLSDCVESRPGNNTIIKGKESVSPKDGLVQGFSASGPDVWVKSADYNRPGVVVSAVGARCGKTFAAEGHWTAIANTHVLLPGKDVDLRWLWYRTNDETFWIRSGTAQPFVRVKESLDQMCSIPPLAEQQRIARELDDFAIRNNMLTGNYESKRVILNNLEKSILQEAFSGNLRAAS